MAQGNETEARCLVEAILDWNGLEACLALGPVTRTLDSHLAASAGEVVKSAVSPATLQQGI